MDEVQSTNGSPGELAAQVPCLLLVEGGEGLGIYCSSFPCKGEQRYSVLWDLHLSIFIFLPGLMEQSIFPDRRSCNSNYSACLTPPPPKPFWGRWKPEFLFWDRSPRELFPWSHRLNFHFESVPLGLFKNMPQDWSHMMEFKHENLSQSTSLMSVFLVWGSWEAAWITDPVIWHCFSHRKTFNYPVFLCNPQALPSSSAV